MPTGSRPTTGRDKPVPRAADRARRCPVCGERLSTYNKGPNCYTHTVRAPWRGPTTPPVTTGANTR
jgi:transcriptional regulator NrdR family protein